MGLFRYKCQSELPLILPKMLSQVSDNMQVYAQIRCHSINLLDTGPSHFPATSHTPVLNNTPVANNQNIASVQG